jgi:hypothetical protein
MMAAFSRCQRGNEMWGEVQILQRKGMVQGESRERVGVDRNLHHLPLLRQCSSSLVAQGVDGVHWWGALGGEERGWEKNGVQGRGLVGS